MSHRTLQVEAFPNLVFSKWIETWSLCLSLPRRVAVPTKASLLVPCRRSLWEWTQPWKASCQWRTGWSAFSSFKGQHAFRFVTCPVSIHQERMWKLKREPPVEMQAYPPHHSAVGCPWWQSACRSHSPGYISVKGQKHNRSGCLERAAAPGGSLPPLPGLYEILQPHHTN